MHSSTNFLHIVMDHSFRNFQFEACHAPSAGVTTQNTYQLTGGNGLQEADQKIVNNLCAALEVRFEDTKQGLIPATSIANFKIWPMQESELEG